MINCGHDPVTFVNGYSYPRYEETQDAEANAAEYRESQKQRYYEREVRQAKLEAIAQDAAGNKDAFNKAAAKVRQANANYKEFCKETGRTPRPDRLQVYTSEYNGNGFGRRMSGRVTGNTKGWTPPPPKPPVQNVTQQATQPPKNVVQSAYKVSSFTGTYGETIAERFKNGNETARKAWEKFIPDGGAVGDDHFTGCPNFSPARGTVVLDIDKDANNGRGVGCTFFHEHGHAIDCFGGWLSDDGSFADALKEDYEDALKRTGKKKKDEQRSALGWELIMPGVAHKANGVSDIVEGLSKGKCHGMYGHGAQYWKDNPDRIQREAFAHMYEAAFLEGQSEMIQKYFPKAWKRFIEILEGVL